MRRRWNVALIGLVFAAVSDLGSGPGEVESTPAGETGGRYLGSRIASGIIGNHTCAVKEDGTVFCWGSNTSGQLGNGSGGPSLFSAAPVQVQALSDAIAVAGGTAHTCALRANGTVVCWGSNGLGRLGDGTTTQRSIPVPVLNPDGSVLGGVVGITTGELHTCAARVDGTVRCWGSQGLLGTGGTVVNPLFAATVVNLTDVVSVAAGRLHTCAVRVTGGVACWGSNSFGQLGTGSSDTAAHSSPVNVPALTDITTLSAGGQHTCALRANGLVFCWGNNNFGQVGDGTTSDSRASPTAVQGLDGVVRLALGFLHSCARRADGDVRCWGRNDNRQVGDLTLTNRPSPVTVLASRTFSPTGPIEVPLLDADGLAAGERHSCSLQVDDKVRCWGANDLGQLGTGNTNTLTLFASIVKDSTGRDIVGTIGARSVAAGSDQACARRADGTVACWESNLIPAAATGFTRTLAVAAGASHKCALRSDGLVRCVGSNTRGQIGNGAGGANAPDVTDPALGVVQTGGGPLTDIAAIAAGDSFTCALHVAGTVHCWGVNDFGQLGNDPSGFVQGGRFEPAPVTVRNSDNVALSNVIAIAAGRQHACAVRVGGTVHCWGFNVFGQVGVSGTSFVGTASQVRTLGIGPGGGAAFVALTQTVAIAAGPDHSCALLVNGTARCWGKNDVGQLGDNDRDFDSFFGAGAHPIAFDVQNLTDAVALAAGGNSGPPTSPPSLSTDFTCTRRVGGTVRCWGDNAFGQLGDDATIDRLSPVTTVVKHARTTSFGSIITLSIPVSGVSAITAGNLFGCALVASGQPFCWGSANTFARPVSSFAFNMDPNVALAGHDRIARVTVLANCPEDQHVYVNASLTQGDASGRGIAVGACTGQLERYPVIVPAHGRAGFKPGAAVVEAEAIIRHRGRVLDVQEWTRQVELQRNVTRRSLEDD